MNMNDYPIDISMVLEKCRKSLLIENVCGWQKITFVLSEGRRVVGIRSQGRGRDGRRVGVADYSHPHTEFISQVYSQNVGTSVKVSSHLTGF